MKQKSDSNTDQVFLQGSKQQNKLKMVTAHPSCWIFVQRAATRPPNDVTLKHSSKITKISDSPIEVVQQQMGILKEINVLYKVFRM